MAITNDRIKEMMKKRLAAKKAAAEEAKKGLGLEIEEPAVVQEENNKVEQAPQEETVPESNVDSAVSEQETSQNDDTELNRLLNIIHKKSTVVNKSTIEEIDNVVDKSSSSSSEPETVDNKDSETANTTDTSEVTDIAEVTDDNIVEKINEEEIPTSVEDEKTVIETVEAEKEVVETEKPTEKKTRKSRKKKDNSAELKAVDVEKKTTINEVAQEIAENIIGTSNQNYTEAIAILTSSYEDDEWIAYKKDIIESMSKIQINADMNPGTLKYALMEINDVEAKLAVRLSEYEAVYAAMIGDYRDGLCNVIRSTNANGSNEEIRRQNGFRALAKVNMGGVDLNFIDIITATRIRLKFMQGIQRRLKSMSAICITMSGALKMEKDLMVD